MAATSSAPALRASSQAVSSACDGRLAANDRLMTRAGLAGSELLAALKNAEWHLMGKARRDPQEQEIIAQITAAIALVEQSDD